ncbi:MAG: hypothetical protein IT213_14700 [Cytophagales bacterium]|nr:hypothetical protein [Cytophagales bacterium]
MIHILKNHRNATRWFLLFSGLLWNSMIVHAQTDIGILISAGNRQHYTNSQGFKGALAPSLAVSLSKNGKLNNQWTFRYGLVAGVLGYKLNVIMIDTLGANGDVSPFPEYSTFFGSAEFILGRRLSVFHRDLLIGGGVGITTYISSTPTSLYGVEVLLPNNNLVSLFEARMNSPATRFSMLWKVSLYYKLSSSLSASFEYIHHNDPAAEGTYTFYHTSKPLSGQINVYQREFRVGVFYTLGSAHTR